MQKRMRHSKFRNTGILFELLTKQVTADIIAGRETSIAKDLLYKYFRENTEYLLIIDGELHYLAVGGTLVLQLKISN